MTSNNTDIHNDKPLTGFHKYFNTTTINGRVNISCATFATLGMYLLYLKFKPKPEKPQNKQRKINTQ